MQITKNYVFFFFLIIECLFSEKSNAQNYISIGDLYTLSAYENNTDYIYDFLTGKGYSATAHHSFYDDYGNACYYETINGKFSILYATKTTPQATRLFQPELNDSTNLCYFLFNLSHGDGKVYESPSGAYKLICIKTDTTWEFVINEQKKGDPSPAHRFGINKLSINSYTSYTNINIKSGDQIYLKATGSITLGPWVGAGGPDGINGFSNYSCNTSFPHGSLIGKIGETGNWFLIGSYKSFTADASGKLYVMVNDCDPSNNSGRFYLEYGINKQIDSH